MDGLQLSTGATTGTTNRVVRPAAFPSAIIANTHAGVQLRGEFPAELPGQPAAWLAADGDRAAALRVMDAPLRDFCRIPAAAAAPG